ncbi:DUF2807 domain-containing protein [Fulvivirga sp. RKSG066]|uniref:head GIN domain-containing protein n=1 Tax=Fulvivirga aurantia TaxID=2529383 RepID=UPI0012BC8E55|nr:head GIN domain-containing protein [Fulvivirga aurantia]MTI20569.1 DUF2807 domain-containing protein [Fulvivirga aurantia]
MRTISLAILTFILCFGCDSTDAPECLKTRGELTTKELTLNAFNSLTVNNEFEVIITEGTSQKVEITAGENLLDEIEFEVLDGSLTVSNHNGCEWSRDYDFPVINITHPNLSNIRQNGGGSIKSNGTLTYPQLTLISEKSSGNFELSLSADKLTVVNNDLSNYYLTGDVGYLNVGFFSGDGRFEGANLLCEKVVVFQRGTNDITVNAQESLTGRIIATGNVIFVGTKPKKIEVSEENRGRLINKTNE